MRLALHVQILVQVSLIGWTACAASPTEANDKPWPFDKPHAAATSQVRHAARVRNPIDAFILRKLEQQKLHLHAERLWQLTDIGGSVLHEIVSS